MKTVGAFLVGVATGWVLRSAFGSFRGLTVSAVASGYDLADRARRLFAEEKEFFEDLHAEGRSRFEATRRGGARTVTPSSGPKAVA